MSRCTLVVQVDSEGAIVQRLMFWPGSPWSRIALSQAWAEHSETRVEGAGKLPVIFLERMEYLRSALRPFVVLL